MLQTTIQDIWHVQVYQSKDEAPAVWAPTCRILALVWNLHAALDGRYRGVWMLERPGYCGEVWIGNTDEWNASSVYLQDGGTWSGWIPINDIVALLRKHLADTASAAAR